LSRSLRNQPSADDQRNVIIATVLVAIVTFVWMFYLGPAPAEQAGVGTPADSQQTAQQAAPTDTAAASSTGGSDSATSSASTSDASTGDASAQQTTSSTGYANDPALQGALSGNERFVVVENERFRAHFTTHGGTLVSFQLKGYTQANNEAPVQLVDTTTTRGALSLSFTTPSNHLVDTRDLYFSTDATGDTIRVTEETRTLTFTAPVGEGTIRQTYTFQPDTYGFDVRVEQENYASYMTRDGFDYAWNGGILYSEGGTETEVQHTNAGIYSGGELQTIALSSESEGSLSVNGDVAWANVKNKYFTAVLMPGSPGDVEGADLEGRKRQRDRGDWKDFTARLQYAPSPGGQTQVNDFQVYLGPVKYSDLVAYERDLYAMVDYGWDFFEWITRPLAQFLFIPIFTYLGGAVPNYGIVLILLALFVKLVTYPLTKKAYRSMGKMRELQPELEELREKYDDDPQKQQQEMMKLYRDKGVNPLGGCLPMFIQYPFLIALYQFIPQSIQLRQESFLWAHDLSVPDKILELPFTIPIYGDYVAGFTLLMGLAMIVQMRIQSTPGTGGGQAQMFMYFMPAFIFFIFNQFASALSLYYLSYNVITAAQQKWIYYQLDQEKEEDGGPRSNGRGSDEDAEPGFFQRLLEKAEEAQKQRQKQQ
jgi:YidC/Oxa1 family membrane protein insertase